ncbi:MAG: ABC transporter ATP-binding protein [Acidimicrobiales bacterium]|nr:ABC transporter ATP-binding protein [Acidimicrobiales bacterium]
MSSVVFEGVTKRFGELVAVDDLTLTVDDSEFMVLLGPSGCGKTTVLRLVAGLERSTAGTLRIGNRVVDDLEAKDRNVAMVFQSYALYPHMTVARNIESPLIARKFIVDGGAPRKLSRSERRERVAEAARILGLGDLLDRKPAALSGGQRQRVALARAIVSRPTVFLMDEPLSNLDAKLRAQTRLELVDLHRRLNTTFIYVTHDQVEAMTMATRIAVMDAGRLQQVGAPQDLYERPANLFVARFIGSPPMNVIEATIGSAEGDPYIDAAEAGRIAVGATVALGQTVPAAGTRVMAGIRPEHLQIAGPGSSAEVQLPTDAGIVATIVAVEWLGHERHVICDAAGTLMTVRESSANRAPAVGERVVLAADPSQVHLFDPVTGERLP